VFRIGGTGFRVEVLVCRVTCAFGQSLLGKLVSALEIVVCCSVLQCAAVCSSVLMCVAV